MKRRWSLPVNACECASHVFGQLPPDASTLIGTDARTTTACEGPLAMRGMGHGIARIRGRSRRLQPERNPVNVFKYEYSLCR